MSARYSTRGELTRDSICIKPSSWRRVKHLLKYLEDTIQQVSAVENSGEGFNASLRTGREECIKLSQPTSRAWAPFRKNFIRSARHAQSSAILSMYQLDVAHSPLRSPRSVGDHCMITMPSGYYVKGVGVTRGDQLLGFDHDFW